MDRLPTVPQAQHTTIMVTGGPATGKTALVNSVQAQRPDIVDNAARINPDDYRALFASPGEFGQAYADMAHLECNKISKAIMSRLQERIATGDAPHVLLDVVSPNERRMALANESNELIVVAGTKSPEAAVEHSFARGQPRVDDATGITVPGRQTPTFVVLDGAAKASGSNPEIFQHPNVSFELFDTNTGRNPETGRFNPPKSIASWDPDTKTMTVHDPDTFIDFVERQNLNDQARSADELFTSTDRTPANIADNLSAYTDRGITVEFENPETNRVAMSLTPESVDKNLQLPSKRGNDFFENVGNSHVTNIKDVTLTKPVVDSGIKPPAAPEVVHTRASAGVGAAGVALGVVGLKNSIEAGDGTGIAVSGLNVGTGTLDVGIDATTALGKSTPTVLRGITTKANIAATVIDGVYQISQEEGVNNKMARGAAVTVTAGTGVGLGMAAAGVAVPIVATVAVGMAADTAVESYKVTNELDESIQRQERPIKVRNEVEASGAPKLSNYTHLRLFAVQEGSMPNGATDVTPQEKSKIISEYEYSKDPTAIKDLETRLQEKINHYDKIIYKNDSWVHDSMRFFGQDEVDAKRMAQIDRTQYMAAMNELKQYKQELADRAPQPVPPQGVISHGTNLSAILPAGATLTVQSSNNNASVMRGVAPDNQIRLMQADGQSSSTLADIERQRNMDQLRAAERAATASDYVSEQAAGLWGGITGLFNDEANPESPEPVMVAENDAQLEARNTEIPDQAIILADFSGSDATYTGDPDLIAETAEAGIPINPALLPAAQIAAASNTFQPQIPKL